MKKDIQTKENKIKFVLYFLCVYIFLHIYIYIYIYIHTYPSLLSATCGGRNLREPRVPHAPGWPRLAPLGPGWPRLVGQKK